MTEKIECATHGWQRPTRVCRHIVDTLVDREPRGFFWAGEADDEDEPCAWCVECNRLYIAAGEEWTDELMEVVDEQRLCFSCFQLAKQINGFGVN